MLRYISLAAIATAQSVGAGNARAAYCIKEFGGLDTNSEVFNPPEFQGYAFNWSNYKKKGPVPAYPEWNSKVKKFEVHQKAGLRKFVCGPGQSFANNPTYSMNPSTGSLIIPMDKSTTPSTPLLKFDACLFYKKGVAETEDDGASTRPENLLEELFRTSDPVYYLHFVGGAWEYSIVAREQNTDAFFPSGCPNGGVYLKGAEELHNVLKNLLGTEGRNWVYDYKEFFGTAMSAKGSGVGGAVESLLSIYGTGIP